MRRARSFALPLLLALASTLTPGGLGPAARAQEGATQQTPRRTSPQAQESPRQAETFEHVVAEGESCALIAERIYGDRRRYDIVHAYNEDLGPLPHRLAPGDRLTLPVVAVRPQGPDAELTSMRPNVRGRPAEQEDWHALRLGSGLRRGWRVNTREEAFAELTFRDESQIALRGDTVVIILGASAIQTRRGASEARLDRGSLRARLAELRGRRLEVSTPSARAALEGGAAVVSVDESDTSRVSNHEGRPARVTTPEGQGAVEVAAGMGSEVRRGERPSPPRPLPAAPSWLDGQPTRWIGVHARTTVAGAWSPVEVARSYRVEITRGEGGAGLVAAVDVPAEVTRFEIHGLWPGRYHARVSTLSRDFFESRPSARLTFEVVLGHLRAPGEPEGHEPSFDPGDPSEEVRPIEVLPGAAFEAPDGLRCALADASGATGEPTARLTLGEGQEGTIRCVDAEGAPTGGFALRVRPAELHPRGPAAEEGPEALALVVGERRTARLRVRSEVPLPASLSARAEGLEVLESGWDGRTLTLVLLAHAEGRGELELVHAVDASAALGRLPFFAELPPRPPPEPEPEPPRPATPPHALHESMASALLASSVGARDIERRGVSAAFTLAYHREAGEAVGDRLRSSLSASGDLFEDRLRLGAGVALDLFGGYDQGAQRGAGDLFASAAYLPRLRDLAMLFELGAFFPTQRGEGGIGEARLVPTVELAGRLFEERLALRTRQSALIDLADNGNASWASSYAADVWILGPLSAGAEVDLTLGQLDRALFFLPVASVAAWVDLGPLSLELAGRFALSEEATSALGAASFLFSIRGGNQPWRPEVGW